MVCTAATSTAPARPAQAPPSAQAVMISRARAQAAGMSLVRASFVGALGTWIFSRTASPGMLATEPLKNAITGLLPITLPGIAPFGAGIRRDISR